MSMGRTLRGVSSDINVTPMVDVMLVLLIIFMVITPMLQKGVSVDMAKTLNPRSIPDADKEDAVVVAVSRDGRIYLGKDQLDIKDLQKKVGAMIADKEDKTVYLKSDSRAKFDQVVKVVNEIRGAGVDKLGLLTDKVPQLERRLSSL